MTTEPLASLRARTQSGKERDPGWYRIHRTWSIRLTRVLLALPVHPEHVSAVMLACGAAGAALIAFPDGALAAAGFALLYLAFLLDKVDGELARARGLASVRGILIDRFHHRLVEPLVFVAAGVRAHQLTGAWTPVVAGFVVALLANAIEEHQQLPPYVLWKHLREGGRWPAAPERPPGRLDRLHAHARVLKGFRTFIVAMPLLAVAYLAEAMTGAPAVTAVLLASAAGLALYLPLQCHHYLTRGLEEEIAAMRPRFTTAADGIVQPPRRPSFHRPVRVPGRAADGPPVEPPLPGGISLASRD